jgi:DNA-binding NtrC family response regulator
MIASSDSNQLSTLAEILKRQELEPICTLTVSECRDILSNEIVGVVFCDRNLSDGDHKDVIKAARSIGSIARVVVTSRQADWDEFREAMREGAFDVIASPCRPKDVEWIIVQAKRDDQKRATQLLASDTNKLARSAGRTA